MFDQLDLGSILCVGYDSDDSVSGEYSPKFLLEGGRGIKVVYVWRTIPASTPSGSSPR